MLLVFMDLLSFLFLGQQGISGSARRKKKQRTSIRRGRQRAEAERNRKLRAVFDCC